MKCLENLKHGFKRKKRCNKYRSEITTQLIKNSGKLEGCLYNLFN